MKKLIIISFFTSCVLPMIAIETQAQTNNGVNVVTTAVPFLRISPDARASGMANMGIATAPDANASWYNSSKTIFAQDKAGIAVNYNPWMKNVTQNMYLATLSGYYKLDESQALTAGLRYFNMGDIQMIDYNGNSLQTARPHELSFDLGYARKLADKLSLGVALRYIYSNLATGSLNGVQYKPGNAIAGDISMYYNGLNKAGQGWALGLALSNLGTKIGYTDNSTQKSYIPANAGIGAEYTAVIDQDSKITFGAEFNKLLVPAAPDSAGMQDYYQQSVVSSWFKSFGNHNAQVSVGAEYNYDNTLFVRAGYYNEDANQGGRKYFTAGLGITYSNVGVNVSYVIPTGSSINPNPLSNTLRFGLVFNVK